MSNLHLCSQAGLLHGRCCEKCTKLATPGLKDSHRHWEHHRKAGTHLSLYEFTSEQTHSRHLLMHTGAEKRMLGQGWGTRGS